MELVELEKMVFEDKQTLSIRTKDHRKAVEDFAQAQHDYYIAKGRKVIELRAKGEPATLILDMVKEDAYIADLRLKRDIAKGLKDNYWNAMENIRSSLSATQSFISVERVKIEKGLYSEGN
jgi:hypothetical protein